MSGSRYTAFISYSHSDERWARWLQRALERYRPPRQLRASHPALPERLYPVFRDRDELPSAIDLTDVIERAMADSEALIVVCSPSAARSQWVNEEIRRFQSSGRGHRVFCLLVAGATDRGAIDCAFPPALLLDGSGSQRHEPLAADVRPGGDGKRNAMLKIAAGMLGIGVDDLKRRDAQRQARLWSAVATGSLAVTVLTIGLAVAAVMARNESEIRRLQAENLIGFMLGDLRGKLEPIGKLELLDAVGDEAMEYFAALGSRGSPQELLDRARALRQIGEVRFNQGQLEPALTAFQQSREQARALQAAEPGNNDYLFELGQAEFWVGYVAWQRNDLARAVDAMQRYMEVSRQLIARAPENPAYQAELAYAHTNLGSVARAQGRSQQALDQFQLAAGLSQRNLAAGDGEASAVSDLANIWSWIGSTLFDLGRLADSEQAFARAASLAGGLHAQGIDARHAADYANFSLLLADAQLRRGKATEARQRIETSRALYAGLVQHDPENAGWREGLLAAELYQVTADPPRDDARRRQLQRMATDYAALAARDATRKSVLRSQAKVERLLALDALARGQAAEALEIALRAQALMAAASGDKDPPRDLVVSAAEVGETLGAATLAAGDPEGARRVWSATLASLGPESGDDLPSLAMRRRLAADLGQSEIDRRASARLEAAGFRDPRFDPVRAVASSTQ